MDSSVDNVCHDIIMEYLMHSCYKNTAKAFDTEYQKQRQYTAIMIPSHKPDAMDIDDMDCDITNGHCLVKDEKAWILLEARKDLYDAIERGDIPKAFDLIQKRFPGLVQNSIFDPTFDNNSNKQDNDMMETETDKAKTYRVLFKLRCQQFIEIVRSSNEVEAIEYAHRYFGPVQNEYHDMITEVAPLIAYAKPEQSEQAHLLSQERRQQLAEEVNCIVLAYCKMPEQTSMEKLQQQYQVVQQELDSLKKVDEKSSIQDKLAL
ncbi:CTLH/CRA C-terminal to lish motif domain-containing protein [Chlamydoabsidia padenii]|nr:CTLH/CRA C-terminal to lish motif domain-containing protein [Chlamydoabsidia padenii]